MSGGQARDLCLRELCSRLGGGATNFGVDCSCETEHRYFGVFSSIWSPCFGHCVFCLAVWVGSCLAALQLVTADSERWCGGNVAMFFWAFRGY